MSFRITHDGISPTLRQAARRVRDKRPILQVMGLALQNFTVSAFVDPSKRQQPWAPKQDGTPSNLTRSTALRRSIRITGLTNGHVEVGTDRAYAAIHQHGGKSRPMPARPYFPFDASGQVWSPAEERIRRAAQKKLDSLLSGL